MKVAFVAGFGPIDRDVPESRSFWTNGLGIAFEEAAPQYLTTDSLDGVRIFALWPLAQAAESTFGSPVWPAEIPPPQAWIELDVESAEAVAAAVEELAAAGHRVLRGAQQEPWGQTTSRLLSPEGLLVGVTFTPVLHGPAAAGPVGE